MSQNIGTLISASIRPNDSLDPIASAFANEIKGGLHTCADAAARNAIIIQRREWGMLVYVTTEDVMYQLQYGYYDTNITNNLNWTVFTGGAQSQIPNEWVDSVISIRNNEPTTPTNPDRYMLGTSSSASITGTNWDSFTATSIVEWNAVTSAWKVIIPTNGTTVRVDTDKNLMYRFDGTFPSGEWKPEKVAQIFYITPNGANNYTATPSPTFSTYDKDVIFLAKFGTNNFGTSSLNINGIGAKTIKVNTTSGIRDLIDGDIVTTALYSLTYDGTNFQMVKPFSSDAQNIKYYIAPGETITVGEYEQYWVYGDLTLDGSLINHGNVVIANGAFVNNSNDFQNYGTLTLVDIKTPLFNDTLAIGFTVSVTPDGSSFSAYIKDTSLLPTHLNTNLNGGATPGYVLSVDNGGYFEWIVPSSGGGGTTGATGATGPQGITGATGSSLGYTKRAIFQLQQIGTASPSIIYTFINETSESFTLSRIGVGQYKITPTSTSGLWNVTLQSQQTNSSDKSAAIFSSVAAGPTGQYIYCRRSDTGILTEMSDFHNSLRLMVTWEKFD